MAFKLDVKIRQKSVGREEYLRQGEALNKSGWWGEKAGCLCKATKLAWWLV